MKILLDENVDQRLKSFLENIDFQIKTVEDMDLTSSSDTEIMETCQKNKTAILTHDDDFLSLADEKKEHPTVIFLPQRIRLREIKKRTSELENFPINNQVIYPQH